MGINIIDIGFAGKLLPLKGVFLKHIPGLVERLPHPGLQKFSGVARSMVL